MSTKPKVIVTRRWPETVEHQIAVHFEATFNEADQPLGRDGLMAALRNADAVFPTVTDPIDAEVLAAEPLQAKLIGNFGVGYNHIDVKAAKARGITVTNTPEVLTDATADLALTLLLMVARRAGEGERHARASEWTGWRPTHMMGTQVTGKTLGIVGFGRIGRAVAERARQGFNMRILYYDRFPVDPEISAVLGVEACETVEELLEQSDFVSLHCPGGGENTRLMNAERFARMPRHAFLVNTARGDVVDEADLVEALRSGEIAGAGLDVFEAEPTITEDLKSMENVVLLPHLGSATRETRVAMGMRVIENAKAFFEGKTPQDRVS